MMSAKCFWSVLWSKDVGDVRIWGGGESLFWQREIWWGRGEKFRVACKKKGGF